MTKRESGLLAALLWICVAFAFAIFATIACERIAKAKGSIVKFHDALASLPDETVDRESLVRDIETMENLRGTSPSTEYLPVSEMAATVRKNLSAHGVTVDRLQTANTGKCETIDFLLSAEGERFFVFLQSMPIPGHGYSWSYLSVKPDSDSGHITVSMRLIHE